MIHHERLDDDAVRAEVRRAREEYAARFNFDLDAIFADLQRRSEQNARDGHKVVSLPPRRPPAGPNPPKKSADPRTRQCNIKPVEAIERGQLDLVWQIAEALRSGSQL
jgi:hypothetical protein